MKHSKLTWKVYCYFVIVTFRRIKGHLYDGYLYSVYVIKEFFERVLNVTFYKNVFLNICDVLYRIFLTIPFIGYPLYFFLLKNKLIKKTFLQAIHEDKKVQKFLARKNRRNKAKSK